MIFYFHLPPRAAAYKHADGKKIDGRRVLVDVERARTVKGWQPRRLGGGLGGTRKGPPEICTKYSGKLRWNIDVLIRNIGFCKCAHVCWLSTVCLGYYEHGT